MTPDPIRAKIIELVPEIKGRWRIVTGSRGGKSFSTIDPEITLADVLRAIATTLGSKQPDYAVTDEGIFVWFVSGNPVGNSVASYNVFWNLTTDYDGQTQEVKNFIGKLLGVTN